MVLVTIVASMFTVVLTEGSVASLTLSQQTRMTQETRTAMNWMVQELRSEVLVGQYHSFDTTNRPDVSSIKFTRNSDGETISYFVDGGIVIKRTEGATIRTLAENVTSLTFTYWGPLGETLSTPISDTDLPNITTILIDLSMQVGDKTITLQSGVSPRNTGVL